MRNLFRLLSVIVLLGSCTNVKSLDTIAISDHQILVNNTPYFIKGICYHPVPKGSDQRNFDSLEIDLKLMVAAGINTIRVYAPIDDIEVLNTIHEAGIKLIIGFGFNQSGEYDILSGSYIDYIKKYKNHESILLWELGNEYNYHPEWFEGDIQNWYNILNKAAKAIHEIDSNHPVTTAHGDLPDDAAIKTCTEIDVWGLNVYRWDDPSKVFDEWKTVSEKPMYLSEAGGDSYMTMARDSYNQGVNEIAQADANRNIMNAVFEASNTCSGVTMFSFVDGWWKAGNNDVQDPGGWAPNSSGVPYDGSPNEEYWGMVDIDRNEKMAYKVLQEIYTTKD